MENRYLKERSMQRARGMQDHRRGRMSDYRDMRDYRGRSSMGMGRSDYRYDDRESDSRYDYNDYATQYRDYSMGDEHYGQHRMYQQPMQMTGRYAMDYSGRRDYRSDYNDYDYNDYNDYGSEEEYKKDLKEWTKKLKMKDKFGVPEKEIIEKAKQMGVKFKDYTEEEYLATYYMLMSDFTHVGNDVHMYLAMAKEFLEDKDIAVSPSEKLCIYMYKIVKGE